MTARTQALIRDIAQLFIKYSLADWAPLIKEFEKGGRTEVAAAVRELASAPRPPARSKRKNEYGTTGRKRKTPSVPAAIKFSAERSEFLNPLFQALKSRVAAPTSGELRELYLSIGIKEPFPKRREEAVEAIVLGLNKLSDAQFQKVLAQVVNQDDGVDRQRGDYERWFNLIVDTKR